MPRPSLTGKALAARLAGPVDLRTLPPQQLLDAHQVARALDISVGRIYTLASKRRGVGAIAVRIGSSVRWRAGDLLAYVEGLGEDDTAGGDAPVADVAALATAARQGAVLTPAMLQKALAVEISRRVESILTTHADALLRDLPRSVADRMAGIDPPPPPAK